MRWMPSRVAELFHEKCVWASTMPGISVAPAPSITVAPTVGIDRVPRPTRRMRLPWTRTSPAKGGAPEPSMIRTLVKSMFVMIASFDSLFHRRRA